MPTNTSMLPAFLSIALEERTRQAVFHFTRGPTMCLAVMLHKISSHRVDLHGKLSGGRNDNSSSTVSGHELGSVQQLQGRDKKSKRLARTCKT